MRAFLAATATTVIVCLSLAGGSATLTACDSDTSGACADDFDCAATQVCKLSSKACEAFVCKVDSDCAAGKSCDDNACL